MSGHSKWHNIQAKKGKADAAKGRIFTKLGREIAVAAKNNPNPETNSKLADIIAKAMAPDPAKISAKTFPFRSPRLSKKARLALTEVGLTSSFSPGEVRISPRAVPATISIITSP